MLKNRFFNYLQFEKRSSAHSLVAYRTDIEQFSTWLARQYDLHEAEYATHFMVRSWMITLMSEGLSASSIRRKASALKTFYRFAVSEQVIVSSPMKKVMLPKLPKRLPVTVEASKLDRLLDAPASIVPVKGNPQEMETQPVFFSNGFFGLRDRCMIELLYSTGIRLSELTGIKETDVDLRSGQLRVLGKRNKERIIPMAPVLCRLLEKYRAVKIAEGTLDCGPLSPFFMTDSGKKLYPKFVYRKVVHYLGLVSSQDRKSPHILRHSFATSLLDAGADLNAIKELLGHASLAATQVYTHNSIERLKAVYQQAHPKA